MRKFFCRNREGEAHGYVSTSEGWLHVTSSGVEMVPEKVVERSIGMCYISGYGVTFGEEAAEAILDLVMRREVLKATLEADEMVALANAAKAPSLYEAMWIASGLGKVPEDFSFDEANEKNVCDFTVSWGCAPSPEMRANTVATATSFHSVGRMTLVGEVRDLVARLRGAGWIYVDPSRDVVMVGRGIQPPTASHAYVIEESGDISEVENQEELLG